MGAVDDRAQMGYEGQEVAAAEGRNNAQRHVVAEGKVHREGTEGSQEAKAGKCIPLRRVELGKVGQEGRIRILVGRVDTLGTWGQQAA